MFTSFLTFNIFAALEQFDILYLISGSSLVTNSMVFLVFVLFIVVVCSLMLGTQYFVIPTAWTIIFQLIYDFVLGLVYANASVMAQVYFPLIATVFFLLVGLNLSGMLPFSFTVTSHLIVTFALASFLFIGIIVRGLIIHKLRFLGLFLPSGAPLLIVPLLVIVEFVSYIARVFSLAIRLFANMMSGHTLLKILAGFGWTLATKASIWIFIAIFPIIIVFLVTILEVGIAVLQAYVFVVLICIYFNDLFNVGH